MPWVKEEALGSCSGCAFQRPEEYNCPFKFDTTENCGGRRIIYKAEPGDDLATMWQVAKTIVRLHGE